MRIIARSTLESFWNRYSDAEQPLKIWYKMVKQAYWKTPNDIKNDFRTADILPNNRVVFNIKGNTYRLIVKVKYEYNVLYIRFIGTHAEYDKIDAKNV